MSAANVLEVLGVDPRLIAEIRPVMKTDCFRKTPLHFRSLKMPSLTGACLNLRLLQRASRFACTNVLQRYVSAAANPEWTNNGRRTPMHPELLAVAKQFAEESPDATGGTIEIIHNEELSLAELYLRNPKRRNAFDGSMMLQLESAVSRLEDMQPNLKLVVCYSEGDDFCSGGDLNFVAKIATPELGRHMSVFMTAVLERLRCLDALTCCYVQGRALGGGAELTTAFDTRVLSRLCEIRFVQARLHVLTGWGGGSRLRKILGDQRAFYYLVSCHGMSHILASNAGYSDLNVQPADGRTMAIMWAIDFLNTRSTSIIRDYKRLILTNEDNKLQMRKMYDLETDLFAQHWGGEAHKNALKDLKLTVQGAQMFNPDVPHRLPST